MSPPVTSVKSTDSTADTLNEVLRLAGVDPVRMRVTNCDENHCHAEGQSEEGKTLKGKLSRKHLFQEVNNTLRKHPRWFKNKPSDYSNLLKPHSSELIFVDYDKKFGPDAILYLSSSGWKIASDTPDQTARDEMVKSLQTLAKQILVTSEDIKMASQIIEGANPVQALLKFLATKTWKDLGLDASPGKFMSQRYAFDVWPNFKPVMHQYSADNVGSDSIGIAPVFQLDPARSSFFSPFCDHEVTLRTNAHVKIPWSDPYLLIEWESFLQENHVKIVRNKRITKYSFKGLPVMEAERVHTGIKLKLFNPAGEIKQQTFIKIPPKPEVSVTVPANPAKQPYTITVYGRKISVHAHFPARVSLKKKKHFLRILGMWLQQVPESMLAPLLDGVGKEQPITIRVAEKKPAQQMKWLARGRDVGGTYDHKDNIIFLQLNFEDKSLKLPFRAIFHETSHAIDDFTVAHDPTGYLNQPNRSAIRDYYVWKLSKLYSPTELVDYDNILTQANYIKQWDPNKKSDEIADALRQFRGKSEKMFVSNYSLEGIAGFWSNMYFPAEYFAENMEAFYVGLSTRKGWQEYRSKEPFLALIGLNYLFHEYNVASIGSIKKEQVFSKRAFKVVLGIDLDNMDTVMETYESAIKDYDARIERNRKDAFAYYGRATINLRQKKYKEVYADCHRLLYLHAKDPVIHAWCGEMFTRIKRYGDAIAAFDRAIAIDSSDWAFYNNRAAAKQRAGDIEGAYDDIVIAKELNSKVEIPFFLEWRAKNLKTTYWPF